MEGKLILIIGPSGSGKSALVSHVRKTFPQIMFPTSWTTRAPREGELDGTSTSGKKYHFVTTDEFLQARDRGAFLEWDFHFNNYYATPAQEVQEALKSGLTVFQEIEINGAKQLLEKFPREQIKIIFITAGSWDALSNRILSRQTISEDELEKRRLRFEEEMRFADQADFVLENKDGELALTEVKIDEIVRNIVGN